MQKILTEKEAEAFLEKNSFRIIERTTIKSKSQIKEASEKIKFPWAMKISSKKIVHKAKIGGVILNIKNEKEAENAFNKLSKIKDFEEALIQPMIAGEKLILGLKNTSEFGIAIMFGHGGSEIEEEKDVSFRVLPITEKDAEQMIKEIKFYKTLKEKNININLIKESLMKLSKLAQKYPNIVEFDINPLSTTQKEAQVIDARIVFEE